MGKKIKWLLNGKTFNVEPFGQNPYETKNFFLGLSTEMIDRIEVIRGPGSAIYGGNAIFGVINIITKKSSFNAFSTLEVTGSNKRGKEVGFNTFLNHNDITVHTNFSAFQTDGYNLYIQEEGNFNSDTLNSLTNKPYIYKGTGPGYLSDDSRGFNALIDVNANDFNLWFYRTHYEQAQGKFKWYPTDSLAPYTQDKYVLGNTLTLSGLSYEFKSNNLSITPQIGFQYYEKPLNNFISRSPDYFTVSNPTQSYGIIVHDYAESRLYFQNDISYKFLSHTLSSGFEFSQTQVEKDDYYKNYSGTTNYGTLRNVGGILFEKAKRYQRGLYIQDEWHISDTSILTSGLRYDNYSDTGHALAPRIAFVTHINNHHIVKAQYAHAYRPPSFFENYQYNENNIKPNLKPEKIDTYEISHIYKNSSTNFKSTLFHSTLYDTITINDITYNVTNVHGKSSTQGLELELTHTWDNFLLKSNMIYTHSHHKNILDDNTWSWLDTQEGSFSLAPKIIANLALTYNVETSYPITLWFHYIGEKKRKESYLFLNKTTYDPINFDYIPLYDNGSTPAEYYASLTQEMKNIAKNMDITYGVRNIFNNTLSTLYAPLSRPNNQDIPYAKRSFFLHINYKF